MRESEGAWLAGRILGIELSEFDLAKLSLAESAKGLPPNPVITVPTEGCRRSWLPGAVLAGTGLVGGPLVPLGWS